jgi:hypothetical protein
MMSLKSPRRHGIAIKTLATFTPVLYRTRLPAARATATLDTAVITLVHGRNAYDSHNASDDNHADFVKGPGQEPVNSEEGFI